MFVNQDHSTPGIGLDADVAIHLLGWEPVRSDVEYRSGVPVAMVNSDVLRTPDGRTVSFTEVPKFSADMDLVPELIRALFHKGIIPSRQDRDVGYEIVGIYEGRHVAEFVRHTKEYPFRLCRFVLAALGKLER